MKNVMSVALAALLMMAPSAYATLVTVGNIQTDDTTNFITDSTTGRMYNRFDATLGRTFSQLTSDTMAGGIWDGWSLATSIESDDLINALFGYKTVCDGAARPNSHCGSISPWTDGMLGNSSNNGEDSWMYESTLFAPGDNDQEIGKVSINPRVGDLYDYEDWGSMDNGDVYTDTGDRSRGYLIYRNEAPSESAVVQATAPSSLSILALGLIGFAARRFKKQS